MRSTISLLLVAAIAVPSGLDARVTQPRKVTRAAPPQRHASKLAALAVVPGLAAPAGMGLMAFAVQRVSDADQRRADAALARQIAAAPTVSPE